MGVAALLGIAVPFLLAWWLARKYKANVATMAIGAAVFIVFALGLESVVHQIVLKGPSGAGILGNTWLYALYGASMAALFEETGRFLAMKFLLRKEPSGALPGVSYGLGHGGIEMFMLFGLGMVSNMVIAIMMNAGQGDLLFANVPPEAMEQVQAQLAGIESITAGSVLVGLWERISALILQLGLSLIMWTAVRRGGKWLWLIACAFLLHFLVDGVIVVLAKSVSMVAVELVCFSIAIAVGAVGWKLGRSLEAEKAR